MGSKGDVEVLPLGSGGQVDASAFNYIGQNRNALTATYIFKDGKKACDDLKSQSKDVEKRLEKSFGTGKTEEPCEGIGDSCFRASRWFLQVLKGDTCFSLSLNAAKRWESFNLAARDDLAKKIVDRLP